MKIYPAPMEGVTGYVFRQVYREMFGGVDGYFTPFLTPAEKRVLRGKERREIDPEFNPVDMTVPQILTDDPDKFLKMCLLLTDLGYTEVNLNAGCPSQTVTGKNRGSGMLKDPAALDRFFDRLFTEKEHYPEEPVRSLRISVKTRLGMEDPEEFRGILPIYNRYPLCEVIIHPRVKKEFYNGTPHMDAFEEAFYNSLHPVCYNGDIWTLEDYERLTERFPTLDRIMIGRGLVADPSLVRRIRGGDPMTIPEYREFSDRLLDGYIESMQNETNAMMRMKEAWLYMGRQFNVTERELKKIYKAKNKAEYLIAREGVLAAGLK